MLEESGQLVEPLALVDLDDPQPKVPDADGRLLVGIATRPMGEPARRAMASLDLTLAAAAAATEGLAIGREGLVVPDVDREVAVLRAVVRRFPQAAVVLGQVLRATGGLSVAAALDVESFAYSMLLAGPEFQEWLAARGDRALPPMVEEPVLVDRDGDVLRITLNRPERRNAYGRQLRDALSDALRVAVADPSLDRVLLTGAGPSFCSGGDLAEFATTPDLVTAHFIRTLGGAGRLVHQLRGRIEVQVHGPCVGAGVELPAFAGTVIAAPGSTFTLPEVAMGLIPGAGGTVSIPRRIGRWRAFYLALTGRPLDAATALGWGLIDGLI
jgi:hypothetical protein